MSNDQFFYSTGKDAHIQKSVAAYDYMSEDLNLRKSSANQQVGRTFVDFDNNISIKSDYNRLDYEYFRGNNTRLTVSESIQLAQKAYEKVGIVKNIIDTMSDLGCQGVRVQHPVRKTERFLQAWFAYVGGPTISERFLNLLYRLCNVPIKTSYGYINYPNEERWSSSKGGLDKDEIENNKPTRRDIPLRYTFVHPNCVEVVGGNAALFIGKPYYVLKVSDTLKSELSKINGIGIPEVQAAYDKLMAEVKGGIGKNTKYIPLDQNKFDVYYYKKDDWQVWAQPILGSIFDNLAMLELMQLADMSALDGAISNIRHWTVGIIDPSNPNNNILPTKAGINKIKNILANKVGGGTMDLVTGPEVKFAESNTQVHKFLGSEKYKVTLDLIYDGMGIPPPLRSSNASTNATNNYVSLKTLIERLQYGRNLLIDFWNKQFKIIQEAMGHKYPGQVTFDQLILSDESAEKTLLIQLVDRDLISAEAVQEYFGFIPEIERGRTKREHKLRKNEQLPQKASQFHNPQIEDEYKKIALQAGDITPGEVGTNLKPRKAGEKPRIDKQHENEVKVAKFKPKVTTNGRPKGKKETKKRKAKPNSKPRTAKGYIEDLFWAEKAYAFISDILSPALINSCGKSNARQLTNQEVDLIEDIKFSVLSNIAIGTTLDKQVVLDTIDKNPKVTAEINSIFENLKASYVEKHGHLPSLDELRKMQVLSYLEANYIDLEKSGV